MQKTGRKRGRPAIEPSIIQLIYTEAVSKIGVSRKVLALQLEEKMVLLGLKPPAVERIEKEISRARNLPDGPGDVPFTLGSVLTWDIAANAIPMLLRIQQGREMKEPPMTIRQARWVAKLAGQAHTYGYGEIGNEARLLFNVSAVYALREKSHEFGGGKYLDTSDLDLLYWGQVSKEEALTLFKKTTLDAFATLNERKRRQEAVGEKEADNTEKP
jgi:hypothetical protein